MAVALEVRPPLLDHRLVEFALTLDSSLLRTGETGKLLLRKVLEGKVPPEVLARPKKGFSMPVRRWLEKEPKALDAALQRLARAGVLRSPRRRRFDGEQAWSLMVLDRWMHP
jgi:asparagine synthase (glutamine-hydrolysing)